MSRLHAPLLLALVTSLASGCHAPLCGTGTVQRQQPDGALVCEPVDSPAADVHCNVDAGDVEIVGGQCVSHVKCDPETTTYDPVTGVCVGSGTGSACPPCSASSPSQLCVTGKLFDFVTNQPSLQNVRYAVYDPLSFLANPNTTPLAEDTNSKGCFTLPYIPVPASGLVAIAVGDPMGATPAVTQRAAVGVQVVAGKTYKVDTYVVAKAQMAAWSAQA